MTDTFRTHTRSLTSPPEHAASILPDDAGAPGGTLLPVRVSRVLASGTTASGILGLW